MNHAYIRPGGVAQDLPPGALDQIREFVDADEEAAPGVRRPAATPTRSSRAGSRASATSTSPAAWRSGVTGPMLRADRLPLGPAQVAAVLRLRDLRLRRRRPGTPATPTAASWSGSPRCGESLQDRRAGARPARRPGPGHGRGQEDRLAGQLAIGTDGMGNSPRPHPAHHGRVDGGPDPPLQAGHRGLPGAGRPGLRRRSSRRAASSACHVVSDGGTRPYRVHFRDPSFTNLQATAGDVRGRHGRRRHRRGRLASTP